MGQRLVSKNLLQYADMRSYLPVCFLRKNTTRFVWMWLMKGTLSTLHVSGLSFQSEVNLLFLHIL